MNAAKLTPLAALKALVEAVKVAYPEHVGQPLVQAVADATEVLVAREVLARPEPEVVAWAVIRPGFGHTGVYHLAHDREEAEAMRAFPDERVRPLRYADE